MNIPISHQAIQRANKSDVLAEHIRMFVVQNPGVANVLSNPDTSDTSAIASQISQGLTTLLDNQGLRGCEQEVQETIQFIFDNYERFQSLYIVTLRYILSTGLNSDYSIDEVIELTTESVEGIYGFTRPQLELVTRVAYQQSLIEEGKDDNYVFFLAFSLLLATLVFYVLSQDTNFDLKQLPATALVQEP